MGMLQCVKMVGKEGSRKPKGFKARPQLSQRERNCLSLRITPSTSMETHLTIVEAPEESVAKK